jgi:hypothetical protein
VVVQSHFSLTPAANFEDGARALLVADAALYGLAHRETIVATVASRGLADAEHLDDDPGIGPALAVGGQASGRVDAAQDPHDFFRLGLGAGQGIVVRSTGSGEVDLRLQPPGSPAIVAQAAVAGPAEKLAYSPPAAGAYALDVTTPTGAANYTVEVLPDSDGDASENANDNCAAVPNPDQGNADRDARGDACDPFPRDARDDADGDGIGGDTDVCPEVADRAQRDWDRDARGDVCDSSAKTTITRVPRRVGGNVVEARVQPAQLIRAANVRFRLDRRSCRGRRCAWKSVTTKRATRVARGRASARVRVRSEGRYRLRVALVHPRLRAARAAPRVVTIRR